MLNRITNNQRLSENQAGLRADRSTVQQIINFPSDIGRVPGDGPESLLRRLQRAFDSVWHEWRWMEVKSVEIDWKFIKLMQGQAQ